MPYSMAIKRNGGYVMSIIVILIYGIDRFLSSLLGFEEEEQAWA
jgi:hypothetical protein